MTIGSERAQMVAHEPNQKSAGIAYLLLFLCGAFAVHRFYLGAFGSGLVMLTLTLATLLLLDSGVGELLLIPGCVWLLIDACLIPDMTRRRNMELLDSLE
jgi:TM2 domain-containing membrane protein YozV